MPTHDPCIANRQPQYRLFRLEGRSQTKVSSFLVLSKNQPCRELNSDCKHNFNTNLFHLLFPLLFPFHFHNKTSHVISWKAQAVGGLEFSVTPLLKSHRPRLTKRMNLKSSMEMTFYITSWISRVEVKTRHSLLRLGPLSKLKNS